MSNEIAPAFEYTTLGWVLIIGSALVSTLVIRSGIVLWPPGPAAQPQPRHTTDECEPGWLAAILVIYLTLHLPVAPWFRLWFRTIAPLVPSDTLGQWALAFGIGLTIGLIAFLALCLAESIHILSRYCLPSRFVRTEFHLPFTRRST